MALISITEYATKYGKDPGNVRRMLLAGRLIGQKIGNQWVLEEDTPYPEDKRVKTGSYKSWRKRSVLKAFPKLAEEIERMKVRLQEIYGDHLQKILLYGDYAKGNPTELSDVEIALLLTQGHDQDMYHQMLECAFDAGQACGKKISVIEVDAASFEARKATVPFYRKIDREAVPLRLTIS